MSGMDWIALKHGLFVHLPIAAALLLPAALIAAQRPGRGIKPWWITCRYVAWAGVLGTGMAIFSGFWAAQRSQPLPRGDVLAKGTLLRPTLFQLHQWVAAATLLPRLSSPSAPSTGTGGTPGHRLPGPSAGAALGWSHPGGRATTGPCSPIRLPRSPQPRT